MEVGEGSLDDPAERSETGAVLAAAAGDERFDAAFADEAAVLVVVVAAVADHGVGASAWPAHQSRDRRNTVEQRDQLGDVVAVPAGQRERERGAFAVDEEVVLRPGSAPIDRARARFGAPFFAWMWLPSTTARSHSMSPAARSWVNNTWCSLSHTPACCHSSSLRQHVNPDPYPSSWGRCIHAIPVCNTNKIPHSA